MLFVGLVAQNRTQPRTDARAIARCLVEGRNRYLLDEVGGVACTNEVDRQTPQGAGVSGQVFIERSCHARVIPAGGAGDA